MRLPKGPVIAASFVAAACRHDDLVIAGVGGALLLREGG